MSRLSDTSPTLREHPRYRRIIFHMARNDWVRTFSLHVLTGAVATLVHYALMWLLLASGMTALPASAFGFAAGATTRFILSYSHVFSPSDAVPVTLFRFLLALGAQAITNVALLDALLGLGLAVWPAQICATVLLTFANFLMYRLWVFR